MKWSWLELRKYQNNPLAFEETLDLKNELLERDTDILEVSPVHIQGLLTVDKHEVICHFKIQVALKVPSTRSLKPVDLPIEIEADEIYVLSSDEHLDRFDEFDAVYMLDNDTVDLIPVICDHILLNIPMQVLTPEELADDLLMPEGEDWQVVSEKEFSNREQQPSDKPIDPRLADLKKFLDQENE